eukprot:gene8231-7569_t
MGNIKRGAGPFQTAAVPGWHPCAAPSMDDHHGRPIRVGDTVAMAEQSLNYGEGTVRDFFGDEVVVQFGRGGPGEARDALRMLVAPKELHLIDGPDRPADYDARRVPWLARAHCPRLSSPPRPPMAAAHGGSPS